VTRDKSYGQYQPLTLTDRFGVWLHRRQIMKYVGSYDGKRVGDFGCGYDATVSSVMLPKVASLTLVDVEVANYLKQYPQVRALEGLLPDILNQVADASLDVVICANVLEHLGGDGPLQCIRHFYRIVAPGGICLINLPSWRGKYFLEFSAYKLGFSPPYEMDDHKMYYDVRDLWPLLVEGGFCPGNIRCFSHKFGLSTFAVCRK